MRESSRRTTQAVGVATMAIAAVGACYIPSLFELCNTGVISGPECLVTVGLLAVLFGAGQRCLLASRTRGQLFILSVVLLVLFALVAGRTAVWTVPLQLAAIGSVAGLAFSLWRWRA